MEKILLDIKKLLEDQNELLKNFLCQKDEKQHRADNIRTNAELIKSQIKNMPGVDQKSMALIDSIFNIIPKD